MEEVMETVEEVLEKQEPGVEEPKDQAELKPEEEPSSAPAEIKPEAEEPQPELSTEEVHLTV
uniref:Fibrous sheath CABYR-binding protein-like n=1 Tax=Steinernema glaseri TaxID=37863 RepID=A0A1I7YJC2_9BILA